MSIVSSACADIDNQILAAKAKELEVAIEAEDWDAVREIAAWMASEPFSE